MNTLARKLRDPLLGFSAIVVAFAAQDVARKASTGELNFVPTPAAYLGISIDPRIVQRLLGLRVLVADLVLIDTLIKSDTQHESMSYTALYRAFHTASMLDPDNLKIYHIGGTYLSVVKDDIKGATALLREGAKYLDASPNKLSEGWRVYFALAYNLIFEENEIEEGARWLEKAADQPRAPMMVRTLAKRASTERGRLELAGKVLNDLYRRASRGEEKKNIETKMLALAARQELLDLNEEFETFLKSTPAYAFSRKRQLQAFLRSSGHSPLDMLGHKLGINETGKIAPVKE